MAVIVKKINGKEYLYYSVREGKNVFQKYIGVKKDSMREKCFHFPKYLFWDSDISKIKKGENARYIISRVLELGTYNDVMWLTNNYSKKKILEFLKVSRQVSEKSKFFWGLWFEDI